MSNDVENIRNFVVALRRQAPHCQITFQDVEIALNAMHLEMHNRAAVDYSRQPATVAAKEALDRHARLTLAQKLAQATDG